ncbi:low-affinity Fe(2+) transport protein [Pichia californica]|uniref:Low-affinity Fe(2+) transport protein n=1 Tax=Pichia californica TaxID=460514 RepID=A0A9P6WHS5_9ASCO|nr:low-affinity Fe(2+) transport protein [[Candida] californica]KAG0686999.1 low-affinity Fe(2+) transport protein [[Candida] californica]
MQAFRKVRNILLPPRKNDIRLRCAIAVRYSEDNNEQNRSLLSEENENDYGVVTGTIDVNEKNNETERESRFLFIKKIGLYISSKFERQKEDIKNVEELEDEEYYISSPLDTFIGAAVDIAGSIYVLFIVLGLLIAWIVWGCISHGTDTWQIVMQDGQSIQTYVWNTFLMRQQMDNDEKLLILYGRLKSRSLTHKRLLEKLVENRSTSIDLESFLKYENDRQANDENSKKLIDFRNKNLYDKISYIVSNILGSLPAVFIYWAGIFIWIGCGKIKVNEGTPDAPILTSFSNSWQMYINTATAIELLITTVFLENVRNRANDSILIQTETFNNIDSDLEFLLREVNENDSIENEMVVVKRCPRDMIQRCISFYAHVVGNGLGLVISICVFSAWLGIGNLMHWSANWWLVIGSYTGLVGFIDGFVLREVFFSITNYEQNKFLDLLSDSQELLDTAGIPVDLESPKIEKTWGNKISIFINSICSNKWSVVVSFVIVIGLVIFASSLLWSETAQLVANTPTMIIEGFFLLILVQAHNWASEERKFTLSELNKSRVLLYNYIKKNHVS